MGHTHKQTVNCVQDVCRFDSLPATCMDAFLRDNDPAEPRPNRRNVRILGARTETGGECRRDLRSRTTTCEGCKPLRS